MKTSHDIVRYTAAEHRTWRHFFAEIEAQWSRHARLIHPWYLAHVDALRVFRDGIPSLAQINTLLATIGWSAVYVDGLAPPWEIAKLLDRRVMPVSRQIRTPDEVFFANGPDLIHDVFGHLPSLLDDGYRHMLAKWSYVASRLTINEIDKARYHLNKLIVQSQDKVPSPTLKHLEGAVDGIDQFVSRHPSPSLLFDKAYFWIFEFGMIENSSGLKILGAGLLSSLQEVDKIATGSGIVKKPLNLDTVLSPYNISALQGGYVIAPSLESYDALIDTMVARLSGADERRYAHG